MSPFSRRSLVLGAGALAAGCAAPSRQSPRTARAIDELAGLGRLSGGRLGAYVHNTGTNNGFGLRLGEPFAMCSTFKMALAGLILMEVDAGRLDFDQRVGFTQADMVPYAPVAEQSLEAGFMTIGHMAQAAQTTSDNVCANLLLRLLGGPEGFTSRVRALGDNVTRVDRYEPELNNVPPGELRDTTTPDGHAGLMQTLLVGDALSEESRAQLIQWMIDTETGLRRIRAGLPPGWVAGDKTGTGYRETIGNRTNDIAIIWPPGRAPVIVTAYLETPFFDGIRDMDQAVLAEVGRIAARWIEA